MIVPPWPGAYARSARAWPVIPHAAKARSASSPSVSRSPAWRLRWAKRAGRHRHAEAEPPRPALAEGVEQRIAPQGGESGVGDHGTSSSGPTVFPPGAD